MLELLHLTKDYGSRRVVNDVSLEIRAGELVVLLGGSGSGKTTLLKMVNGLHSPTSGEVRWNGTDTRQFEPHELRRQIGYVFQEVGLFPHLTVAENIALGPQLAHWKDEETRQATEDVLRLVELAPEDMLERLPAELSGGQRQRVGFARALITRPGLMLLDEPFGALDPLTRARLQQSFVRIRREVGLTAIFVTHDMVEAMLLADRIAILQEGKLVQWGTPRELIHSPASPAIQQMLRVPLDQVRQLESLLAQDAS